ncbi:hypothetical protein BDV93DRAFT_167312 [Ceratobasidium sp. AG-I]|nr:hypothetical protein BDV93DRAFT_167312 [Ceratobasidium sp. AG-I]
MPETMALSALSSEIQLCILQHLSTRRLLSKVAPLSKEWFYLTCELIRQRAVRLLGKPGVSVVVSTFYVQPLSLMRLTISPARSQFETSKPSDYLTKANYTLTPLSTCPFEPIESECKSYQLPRVSFGFSAPSTCFSFDLDDGEYFESFLWTVWLTTQRSIQYRVSPPASPRLLSFDRTVQQQQKVQEGLDRLRRIEFPDEKGETRTEERELTGEGGPALALTARLMPARSTGEKNSQDEGRSEFRMGFETLKMDAASLLVVSEDQEKATDDLTVLICGV